jgi:hypothetical protein
MRRSLICLLLAAAVAVAPAEGCGGHPCCLPGPVTATAAAAHAAHLARAAASQGAMAVREATPATMAGMPCCPPPCGLGRGCRQAGRTGTAVAAWRWSWRPPASMTRPAALLDADAPPVWRSAAVLRLPLARPPRRGLALLSTLLI